MKELKGDQYSGNWHKDKKHGYGKYVWSDGDVYEGNWEADLRAGDGTCIYANGLHFHPQNLFDVLPIRTRTDPLALVSNGVEAKLSSLSVYLKPNP